MNVITLTDGSWINLDYIAQLIGQGISALFIIALLTLLIYTTRKRTK